MLIKKVFYVSLAVLLLISWAGSVVFAAERYQQPPHTVAELDRVCKKHASKNGFADVRVGSLNFQNQSGRISVPCTLHVKQGSTFQMSNVTIESKNFVITSDNSDHPERDLPVHVVLSNVKAKSQEGNFQINASSTASTIIVKGSTIDYPNLVGISAGPDHTDTKSSIELTGNKIRSIGQGNEGIWIISSNKAIIKDNKFEFYDPEDVPVIISNSCVTQGNINANQSCLDF